MKFATVLSAGLALILYLTVSCQSFPQSMPEHVKPTQSSPQYASLPDANDFSGASSTLQPTTSRPRMPIATPNFPRVAIPFIIAAWIFSACLVKITLNHFPRLVAAVPESCWLILAGFAVGSILYCADIKILSPLSSSIFFFCMLPPIIFDAGYFMPNRPFFDHLGTILLFAVVGTFFNTITIGLSLWACGLTGIYGFDISLLEVLIFSSLISAVDPVAVLAVFEEIHVDQVLYIIVFGESLLNDAVTVVLYNLFDSYYTLGPENIDSIDVLSGFAAFTVVALGGSAIGVLWGFLTGFVTRFTHRVLLVEPAFIFIMSYLAYLNAEAFQMSGILSIMFCGITMKNYVAENVSPKSLTTVKCSVKMFSHTSEAIVFMFLGINTVNDEHEWNTAFILLTIFFCSVYRAIGVIILTELANYFRLHQLNRVEKFVMSYGGLRGAIAFALVLLVDPKRIPRQPLFVTATISVVFFTVFLQGITIKPLVEFLKVKREEKRVKTMNERIHEKLIDYTMTGVEDILGQRSSYKYRDKFKHFDYTYIRPYLIREKSAAHGHEPKILETYSKLTMKDAVNFARRNPSSWALGSVPSHQDASEGMTSHQNQTMPTIPTNESGIMMMDTCGPEYAGESKNDWAVKVQYNPSEKDLADARMHHLLLDSAWKSSFKHFERYNGSEAVSNLDSHKIRITGSSSSQRHRHRHGKHHNEGQTRHRHSSEGHSNRAKGSREASADHDSERGISFTVPPHPNPQQSVTVELPPPWKDDLNSSPAIRMDEEPQLH